MHARKLKDYEKKEKRMYAVIFPFTPQSTDLEKHSASDQYQVEWILV